MSGAIPQLPQYGPIPGVVARMPMLLDDVDTTKKPMYVPFAQAANASDNSALIAKLVNQAVKQAADKPDDKPQTQSPQDQPTTPDTGAAISAATQAATSTPAKTPDVQVTESPNYTVVPSGLTALASAAASSVPAASVAVAESPIFTTIANSASQGLTAPLIDSTVGNIDFTIPNITTPDVLSQLTGGVQDAYSSINGALNDVKSAVNSAGKSVLDSIGLGDAGKQISNALNTTIPVGGLDIPILPGIGSLITGLITGQNAGQIAENAVLTTGGSMLGSSLIGGALGGPIGILAAGLLGSVLQNGFGQNNKMTWGDFSDNGMGFSLTQNDGDKGNTTETQQAADLIKSGLQSALSNGQTVDFSGIKSIGIGNDKSVITTSDGKKINLAGDDVNGIVQKVLSMALSGNPPAGGAGTQQATGTVPPNFDDYNSYTHFGEYSSDAP